MFLTAVLITLLMLMSDLRANASRALPSSIVMRVEVEYTRSIPIGLFLPSIGVCIYTAEIHPKNPRNLNMLAAAPRKRATRARVASSQSL